MSLTDKLENYFRQRPDMWVDGMQLAQVAGCYAWRSRCADLRRRGMTIENKQQKRVNADGKRYTVSYYRYRPVIAPQPSLFL